MQHSLGAMHLMGEAITQLRQQGHDISPVEAEAVRACILLHDIGHGPFSHALENSLVHGISHEEISLLMMQQLNAEFGGKLNICIRNFHQCISQKVPASTGFRSVGHGQIGLS